ncbi:MAG: hypothetical protein ACJ8DP_22435 [Microvirga sp.]|jgi:hypothetical protein
MRPIKVPLALVVASSVLGACSTSHLAGVAQSPNPPAPPGYRVVCSSVPTVLNGYTTYCTPVLAPVIEERVIVRAKG